MIKKTILVSCEYGIAHKLATEFVRTANEYQCALEITLESYSVNAKSLLGVVAMGVKQGEQIILSADGPDEVEAVDALLAILG